MANRAVKITAVVLSILIISLGFILSNAQAQETVMNPPPVWFEDPVYNGSHYFLRAFDEDSPPYLHWQKPELEKMTIYNRVKVNGTEKVYFPWMRSDWSSLTDVYFDDSQVYPRISIVISGGSTPTKVLNFEIWFDFDGLAKKESDVEAKAIFAPYITMGRDTTEIVDIQAKEIKGEMKNFSYGNIKLVVWRSDNQTEPLLIYCGAFNSYSWIVVPFQFYRPTPEYNFSDPDNRLTQIATVLIIVGAIIFGIVVYYLYWSNKQKKKDEEATPADRKEAKASLGLGERVLQRGRARKRPGGEKDEDESLKSKRDDRRKRKDRQKQKGKRFYRKNR